MGGLGTVPPEAWNREHLDHNWWADGLGWCYAEDCSRHLYRVPGGSEPEGAQPFASEDEL